MPFQIHAHTFHEGETIPKRHSGEGENLSPPLDWSDVPNYTRSFVLVADDPDAPAGTWDHWLIWDIPAKTSELPEGCQPGFAGVAGTNSFGALGYGGPMPPAGHGPHRYFFHLYALDISTLHVHQGARRAELERAMRGHVLEEACVMGRYERP
jgi:Raf kinase inhibitor-like YbhB/YbcL family protein